MTGRRNIVLAMRAALGRLPFMVLLFIAMIALALAFLLLCRQHERRGAAAGAMTAQSALAYGEEAPAAGRFSSDISYTCIDAPDREVASAITWDDNWFQGDSYAYNHELAQAGSVLAALAYAESNHYQESYQSPPYMENALAQLGFSEMSTDSYAYRSEVVDQVLNFFTQQDDTVAYTLARKRVLEEGGSYRSIILVSIRGSYGSEWFSNLNLEGSDSGDERSGLDHPGYMDAVDEVCEALAPWIARSRGDGDEVTLLLVGHSRGGAIANLVAARADDEMARLQGEGAAGSSNAGVTLGLGVGDAVTAYTFASPACTTSGAADDARYANIFNIVNPADLMPYLPLASWGYERYGVDLCLPSIGDSDFEDRFASMSDAYHNLTGQTSPYDPEAARAAQQVVAEIGERIESFGELATPSGVATIIQTCAAHIDPLRILCGHYPSVYISWMLTLDAAGLISQA